MNTNENSKEKSKKTLSMIITIFLILFLMISVVTVTYAAFFYGKRGSRNNTVSTGSLTFTYEETTNGISLTNAMPISDEVGKKLDREGDNSGYFDFNINYNTSKIRNVNYEIYATPIRVNNPLSSEFVKIYLTDSDTEKAVTGYDKEVPTFNELKKSSIDSKSKRLYYGSFSNTESKNFRLRLWLSKDYEVTSEMKSFKMKVNVSASDQ